MPSWKLGLREYVALGLLAVAIVGGLAVTFFRDDNEGAKSAAEAIGEQTRTAAEALTPQPTATPTPGNPIELEKPEGWNIAYASISTTGNEIIDGRTSLDTLDVTFDSPPFPDFRDDSWKVIAETGIFSEPGRWMFSVEYSGEIRVLIDGREVGSGASEETTKLDVVAEVTSTAATLTIEVKDAGETLMLRWP